MSSEKGRKHRKTIEYWVDLATSYAELKDYETAAGILEGLPKMEQFDYQLQRCILETSAFCNANRERYDQASEHYQELIELEKTEKGETMKMY